MGSKALEAEKAARDAIAEAERLGYSVNMEEMGRGMWRVSLTGGKISGPLSMSFHRNQIGLGILNKLDELGELLAATARRVLEDEAIRQAVERAEGLGYRAEVVRWDGGLWNLDLRQGSQQDEPDRLITFARRICHEDIASALTEMLDQQEAKR